ncbi:ABC transporter ATP-binding protein [Salinifilum aidingensis]
MEPAISTRALTRSYRGTTAVEDVDLEVRSGTITGLLGRNGAGKTTLMRLITAHEFASSGSLRVFGEDPVENEGVLRRMVFVREDQVFPEIRVRHAVRAASWFHPNWSEELAARLIEDFDLPVNRQVKKLSRGMRSALSIVVGLASRAELTIFDEPYAGLDAAARQLFYDRMLADYAERPRTVLLSTHLVDEAADLLEDVVMLDRGRLAVSAPSDEVRGSAVTVTGAGGAVEEFVTGSRVLHRKSLGSRSVVTIAEPFDSLDQTRAARLGLRLEPLSLQQLLVQTSGAEQGES